MRRMLCLMVSVGTLMLIWCLMLGWVAAPTWSGMELPIRALVCPWTNPGHRMSRKTAATRKYLVTWRLRVTALFQRRGRDTTLALS